MSGAVPSKKRGTPSSKAANAKQGRKRATRAGSWWAGLCCGVMLLVSPGTSLMLGALLLPGLVGLAMGGRFYPTARAMLLFGLAGSVGSLLELIGAGASVGTAMTLLHRPTVLVAAWVAAGAGWLVTEAVALAIMLSWTMRDGAHRRMIDQRIAEAEAEWGPLR